MYNVFKKLLAERNVTTADVSRGTGIRESVFSNWKTRGGNLSAKNAQLVANYFNVPLDYLCGNDDDNFAYEYAIQSLFRQQLELGGWKVDHVDPAEGRPCAECMSQGEIDGTPWWGRDDGEKPVQMCEKCVLHDDRYVLTKGDTVRSFTRDEYYSLVNRNQNEAMESVLQFDKDGDDDAPYRIPIVRRVAAGLPLDSIDEIIDWEDLPSHMAKRGTHFGLKIQGDSMMPTIADGDVVICREQPEAEDGQIVVALINGNDGVCKRLKKYPDGTIALMSDNIAYQPMYFSTSEIDCEPVRIKGIVKEMRRKF